MKQVKITLSDELYAQLKKKSDTIGISLPQFIKFATLKEAQIQGIKGFGDDLRYLNKRVDNAELYM